MNCSHGSPAAPVPKGRERWALVGNPNTGKSSLINALAGADLEVGNWPGTTLERLSAPLLLGGERVELVDLPGAYSLLPTSPEEALVLRELLNAPPDRILNVLDAGNLERSLVLTLELMELGLPMAVVVNLLDEARAKGLKVDLAALEEALGLPVAGAVAARGQVEEVRAKALRARVPQPPVRYPEPLEGTLSRLTAQGTSRGLALLALLEEVPVPLPPPIREAARWERERLLEEGHDPYLLALRGATRRPGRSTGRPCGRRGAPLPSRRGWTAWSSTPCWASPFSCWPFFSPSASPLPSPPRGWTSSAKRRRCSRAGRLPSPSLASSAPFWPKGQCPG